MNPIQCEFLIEDLNIEIIPRRNEAVLHLVCGDVGPFEAGVPIQVPLWLAVDLRRKHYCHIVPPEWLCIDELKKMVILESEIGGLTPIPHGMFEISHILVRVAKEDLAEGDQLKTLVQDLWDKREAKLRTSSLKLLSQHSFAHARLDNVQPIEVSGARPNLSACRRIAELMDDFTKHVPLNCDQNSSAEKNEMAFVYDVLAAIARSCPDFLTAVEASYRSARGIEITSFDVCRVIWSYPEEVIRTLCHSRQYISSNVMSCHCEFRRKFHTVYNGDRKNNFAQGQFSREERITFNGIKNNGNEDNLNKIRSSSSVYNSELDLPSNIGPSLVPVVVQGRRASDNVNICKEKENNANSLVDWIKSVTNDFPRTVEDEYIQSDGVNFTTEECFIHKDNPISLDPVEQHSSENMECISNKQDLPVSEKSHGETIIDPIHSEISFMAEQNIKSEKRLIKNCIIYHGPPYSDDIKEDDLLTFAGVDDELMVVTLPMEQLTEVILSAFYSPSDVFLIVKIHEKKIKEISNEVSAWAARFKDISDIHFATLADVTIHLPVLFGGCAIYQRAIITDKDELSSTVSVRLIDDGRLESGVALWSLRRLSLQHFKIPALAIRCSLNISPAAEKWSDTECSLSQSIARKWSSSLAFVMEPCQRHQSYIVDLYQIGQGLNPCGSLRIALQRQLFVPDGGNSDSLDFPSPSSLTNNHDKTTMKEDILKKMSYDKMKFGALQQLLEAKRRNKCDSEHNIEAKEKMHKTFSGSNMDEISKQGHEVSDTISEGSINEIMQCLLVFAIPFILFSLSSQKGLECAICQQFIDGIGEKEIRDKNIKQVRDQILSLEQCNLLLQKADRECREIISAPVIQGYCEKLVNREFENIIHMIINDEQPGEICRKINMC
uniref:GINS complex subunit 2 n=1 Tax=Heterorhabditis bacteriophora TaxID=37862 RepID=A0A1I7XEN1_HETBA